MEVKRHQVGPTLSANQPLNIVSAEFKADPFPLLARLRASDPVYRTTLPDKTVVWLLTRYDDVTALLRDERFTKNRQRSDKGATAQTALDASNVSTVGAKHA